MEPVFVWDLRVNDRYLRPGRYTATLRAFDDNRTEVIDRSSPASFRVPKSFASTPNDCG